MGKYKEYNGTFYSRDTSCSMILCLERIKRNKTRVRFHWGDVQTGEDWGDDYDVVGTIGRSTGPKKIPILLYNARSTGGTGILAHCIVKIVTMKGKHVLYEHPKYHEKGN